MTYKDSGVNYDVMDPFKRRAQQAARKTAGNISRFNGGEFREFEPSRGESVYLIEAAKSYFAHVEEGLGTKNLVADAMYALTGKSYYDHIAQDAVAMIVNDMSTLGALPLSVAMHLAVGSSNWFEDELRSDDLIRGWQHGCNLARCIWGGGETPTLKDIVIPGTIVLSGSAMGIIKPKERLINGNIQHGDCIILLTSSGPHANGFTLARTIAENHPDGYNARLSDNRTYGEALLDPTHIYVGFVEDCLDAGVEIHYGVNITGHGWRKLMRAPGNFMYIIDVTPKPQPVFDFIREFGRVSDHEAYGNLNMGAGFALYVPQKYLTLVRHIHAKGNYPFDIIDAGDIMASSRKGVLIKPVGLEYDAESLAVR
ncbi:phosphoribosylformylglycinamidine cyclo-ligase [Patescibacteria group bacterium]|nr:phosphoribosylformylglycinamidine cyclo-ligase [Patescibacteria group bacterium]